MSNKYTTALITRQIYLRDRKIAALEAREREAVALFTDVRFCGLIGLHDDIDKWLAGSAFTPTHDPILGDNDVFGVRSLNAETDCQHHANRVHFHGWVTDNPNDYRCTVCNAILNFTPEAFAAYSQSE